MANLKTIKEEKKKKTKKKSQYKYNKQKDDVAYTPLTEAQKKLERLKLIQELKSGKRGNYTSPGGTYYDEKLQEIGPLAKIPKKKKKK